MAIMMLIKTMAKMNEFVEFYDVQGSAYHLKHTICDSKRNLRRQWKNYALGEHDPESAQDGRTSRKI